MTHTRSQTMWLFRHSLVLGSGALLAIPGGVAAQQHIDWSNRFSVAEALRLEVPSGQDLRVGETPRIQGSLTNLSDTVLYFSDNGLQLQLPRPLAPPGDVAAEWIHATLPPGAVRTAASLVPVAPQIRLPLVWMPRTGAAGDRPGLAARFWTWLRRQASLRGGSYDVETLVQFALDSVGSGGQPRWLQLGAQRHEQVVRLTWGFLDLVPGLVFGAVLVAAIQLFHHGRPRLGHAGRVVVGAALLSLAVGALSASFGQLPIFPSINMETPLQAVAAGVIIQILGYPYFEKLVLSKFSPAKPPVPSSPS